MQALLRNFSFQLLLINRMFSIILHLILSPRILYFIKLNLGSIAFFPAVSSSMKTLGAAGPILGSQPDHYAYGPSRVAIPGRSNHIHGLMVRLATKKVTLAKSGYHESLSYWYANSEQRISGSSICVWMPMYHSENSRAGAFFTSDKVWTGKIFLPKIMNISSESFQGFHHQLRFGFLAGV